MLKVLLFIGGWAISVIDIILPYRLRVVYRNILGFFAKILMRFDVAWEFADQYTFASEQERDLLKKKSK